MPASAITLANFKIWLVTRSIKIYLIKSSCPRFKEVYKYPISFCQFFSDCRFQETNYLSILPSSLFSCRYSFKNGWIKWFFHVELFCQVCTRPPEICAAPLIWSQMFWLYNAKLFFLIKPGISPRDPRRIFSEYMKIDSRKLIWTCTIFFNSYTFGLISLVRM